MALVKYTGSNFAIGQLFGGISNSSGTLILSAGQWALFPSTFPFKLKIEQFDVQSRVVKREIVKCTNRSSDTFTIVRSHEACPADYSATTQTTTAFAFNSWDTVSLVVTADTIDDIQDEIENKLSKSGWAMTGVLNLSESSDIASATTTNLATATGNKVHITGVTTITWFGTMQAWTVMYLTFDWILTLTHNATSLILPTGANIATTAWDNAIMISEWGGNWRCISYLRADGNAIWAVTPSVKLTQQTFTAGENLTAGDAVYVLNSDGKVYKTDGGNSWKINFVWFATQSVSTNASVMVDTSWVSATQSGLTIASPYFLQEAASSWSLTNGFSAGGTNQWWDASSREQVSTDFTPSAKTYLGVLNIYMKKTGTPADNTLVKVWLSRWGSELFSWSVSNSTLTTSEAQYPFTINKWVRSWTTYYITLSRSWAVDGSNYLHISQATSGSFFYRFDGASWVVTANRMSFSFAIDNLQQWLGKIGIYPATYPQFIGQAVSATSLEIQSSLIKWDTDITVWGAWTATALPANPLGYYITPVNWTLVKIPYYNL